MTKDERQKVYEKYNGHCAYCGKELLLKDMQVDHLVSKRDAELGQAWWDEVESFNNYMPSCRRCNHYKRANSLETFRQMIEEIPKKLQRDNYIYKVALDYKLVEEKPHEIKFYFERVNNEK